MSELDDRITPESLYVVKDGPLKGGYVSIISVEDDGQRIRALVSRGDVLTPPVFLRPSQLKRIRSGFSLLWWWSRACIMGLLVSLLIFFLTHSSAGLVCAMICLVICLIYYLQSTARARRMKSCPLCGNRLDPETWSLCVECGWKRPMPDFPAGESWAPEAITDAAGQDIEPTAKEPRKARWYVKVFSVQSALLLVSLPVGVVLLPFQLVPQPWHDWALKIMAAVCAAIPAWNFTRETLALVRNKLHSDNPYQRKSRRELFFYAGIFLLMGTIAAFAPLHLNLHGVGPVILRVAAGYYLWLMGLCLSLWGWCGAVKDSNTYERDNPQSRTGLETRR